MHAFRLQRADRRSRVVGSLVAILAGLAVVVLGGSTLAGLFAPRAAPAGPSCMATAGHSTYGLDRDQGRNATTIAGVGKRMGLPDHAISVALATALQESALRNVTHGDRDSVGLFQQRPSQGWGSRSQILSPAFAAEAFYGRLVHVPGWEAMAVTEAAQAVQRSAAPDAYGRWEGPARILAQALTGEVPAGFTCRHLGTAPPALKASALGHSMARDLGSIKVGTITAPARGWTAASWLVAHGPEFGVTSVAFGGKQWRASTGAWTTNSASGSVISINDA